MSRAYFHVKATRKVFIEIPAEDKCANDGGMVDLLNWCLHATRDAEGEHLFDKGFSWTGTPVNR